jgi:hypothetical protein
VECIVGKEKGSLFSNVETCLVVMDIVTRLTVALKAEYSQALHNYSKAIRGKGRESTATTKGTSDSSNNSNDSSGSNNSNASNNSNDSNGSNNSNNSNDSNDSNDSSNSNYNNDNSNYSNVECYLNGSIDSLEWTLRLARSQLLLWGGALEVQQVREVLYMLVVLVV